MKRQASLALLLPRLVFPSGHLLAEDQGTARLGLRVENHAGAPIPGAEVQALRVADSEGNVSVAETSTTDQEGSAGLVLEPGTYQVRAVAAGYLEQVTPSISLEPGSEETLALKLFPGSSLGGRVLAQEGKAVEGAQVCVQLQQWHSFPAEALGHALPDEGKACVESEEDGKAQLPDLPLGRYRLRIEAPNRVPLEASLELKVGLPAQEWRLRSGGTIAGRVVDDEDRGVSGAMVRLRHRQRKLSSEQPTDEEGRFRVGGLAPGFWSVRVEPTAGTVLLRDGVDVEQDGTVDLGILRVRPGSALEGRVTDLDGAGLGGTNLQVHESGKHHRLLRRTTSDEEGRFLVAGLLEGQELELLVRPPKGYAARIVKEVIAPRRNLLIEVEDAGSICGDVRVEGGSLPSSIRITARTLQQGWMARYEGITQATTDEVDPASGSFCIESVLPGEEVKVTARAPGYWSEPSVLSVEPGQEAGPLELRLQRGLVLEGLVLDREGTAIPEASVGSTRGTQVFTDALGSFRLEGLRPGMNTIVASHHAYASSKREIMLPVPEEERVVLELGRGGAITGSVLDFDRQPVQGVAITLTDPDRRVFTGADGRYRLDRVLQGSRHIRREGGAGYQDFEERQVEVVEGQAVTVNFFLGAVLQGRVLRGGAPIPGAFISIAQPSDWDGSFHDNHAAQQTFSSSDGYYRLAGVRAGWGTVTVEYERQSVIRPVEIPSGKEPRLDLDLPDQPVRGSVLATADDRPISGASVDARLTPIPNAPTADSSSYFSRSGSLGQTITYSITASSQARTSSDPEGNFELFVDGSGESAITAHHRDYESSSVAFDPADPGPLIFRLSRELRLIVRLRDSQGRPLRQVEACFIQATSGGESRACGMTQSDTVEQALREGNYTILAASPGFGTRVLENHEVKVDPEGGPEELILNLLPGAALRIRLIGQSGESARVVSLVDPAGNERSVLVKDQTTDPATGDKRWTTWPLEPGVWQVTVDPGNGDPISKKVEVSAGPDVEITFP